MIFSFDGAGRLSAHKFLVVLVLCVLSLHLLFSWWMSIPDSVLLVWTKMPWFSLFGSFCFYLSFLCYRLLSCIFGGHFCPLSCFISLWGRWIIFGEKGLEASVGVHSMRVLPYFILNSLHGGHMARFLLLWTNGSGPSSHFNFTSFLHEFV